MIWNWVCRVLGGARDIDSVNRNSYTFLWTSVLPRPLKRIQVSARGGVLTSRLIPWASVLSRKFEQLRMSIPGG